MCATLAPNCYFVSPLGALRCSGVCVVLIFRFPGCPWLPLVVHGCSWPVPGCSWLLLVCSWLLMAAPGCLCLLLVVSGCCIMSTVDPKKTTCLGSYAVIIWAFKQPKYRRSFGLSGPLDHDGTGHIFLSRLQPVLSKSDGYGPSSDRFFGSTCIRLPPEIILKTLRDTAAP
jgi:hypothetical protein